MTIYNIYLKKLKVTIVIGYNRHKLLSSYMSIISNQMQPVAIAIAIELSVPAPQRRPMQLPQHLQRLCPGACTATGSAAGGEDHHVAGNPAPCHGGVPSFMGNHLPSLGKL